MAPPSNATPVLAGTGCDLATISRSHGTLYRADRLCQASRQQVKFGLQGKTDDHAAVTHFSGAARPRVGSPPARHSLPSVVNLVVIDIAHPTSEPKRQQVAIRCSKADLQGEGVVVAFPLAHSAFNGPLTHRAPVGPELCRQRHSRRTAVRPRRHSHRAGDAGPPAHHSCKAVSCR